MKSLVFLFLIAYQQCHYKEAQKSLASSPDFNSEISNRVIHFNVPDTPREIEEYLQAIAQDDTLNYYNTISLDGFKRINDSVSIIIYSLSTGVGSTTLATTFKHGEWFEEEVVAKEADADLSRAIYEYTEFETIDTINFSVFSITETVKDTSLFDLSGYMKGGRSFEDEETIVDTVISKYRVLDYGHILIQD
jgi:hypothetical protein